MYAHKHHSGSNHAVTYVFQAILPTFGVSANRLLFMQSSGSESGLTLYPAMYLVSRYVPCRADIPNEVVRGLPRIGCGTA